MFDLVEPSKKERAAKEQLGEYTANRPDVDGITVLFHAQHDFGGAVPEGLDFAGEGLLEVGDVASEPKVSDPDVS